MKLYYAGTPGEGFGWGTANTNLIKELGKRIEIWNPTFATLAKIEFQDLPDVCFMPLADHDFNPISNARGKINLAYTFFEYPLGPKAAENAAKYDVVFAGSTWCLERMKERGITNGELLIQGVDQEIFHPVPGRKPDGQFRIFSGGKFEYRKGQDLVIAAFKEFSKTHPDAHLVCSWFNPWPQLIRSMFQSSIVNFGNDLFEDHEWQKYLSTSIAQSSYFGTMPRHLGLSPSQFTILPQLPQRDLAKEMANTDCGLFPNRCEGGTNLVLMEYLSCGRSVVANTATGHADIEKSIQFMIRSGEDENKWASQTVDEIVDTLSFAYKCKDRLPFGRPGFTGWTWAAAADKIIATLTRLQERNSIAT